VGRLKSGVFDSSTDLGESSSSSFVAEFEESMDDDLNLPQALAALYGFQRTINSAIDAGRVSKSGRDAALGALKKVDSVLGVLRFEDEVLPDALMSLVKEREAARKKGDYKRADELRDELKQKGIVVQDAPGGTKWKRA